ncbi:mannosidase, beta A, lysosomal L-like [Pelomyxa schiedti]|nr:mannosidase, beta A, lysosomal L-like [Pelomyxa schiedti]
MVSMRRTVVPTLAVWAAAVAVLAVAFPFLAVHPRAHGHRADAASSSPGVWYQSLEGGSGAWTVANANGSIAAAATVPGDVHTALYSAGLIPDPYWRDNDVTYRWVALDDWTYSMKFVADSGLLLNKVVMLVCEGLDTVATVTLNSVQIGQTDNQFRRYSWDVSNVITSGYNTISIKFQSAATYAADKAQAYPYSVPFTAYPTQEPYRNFIRKSQCSFAWDWGPCFIPQGIWKAIGLQSYSEAVITDSSVQIFPVSSSIFTVMSRVELTATAGATGKLVASIPDLGVSASQQVTLQEGSNWIIVNLTCQNPDLWWPVGLGPSTRKIYELQLTFTGGLLSESSISRNVGFRDVKVVQDELSDGESFYFTVNGVPVFAKGANWIPADSFHSRVTHDILQALLQSAVDANMNIVRVWGGGIYQNDEFYDLADEMGLMVWQEFMFACSLYPRDKTFLANVAEEVAQQVRRLESHPSVVIWGANNENEVALAGWYEESNENKQLYTVDYSILYINTIRTSVRNEDMTRDFQSSSPTNAPLVDSNEMWVGRWGDGNSETSGDLHFYSGSDCWDVDTFPNPRFASEYGYQSFPSMYTWSEATDPSDWYIDSPMMEHRQHSPSWNEMLDDMISLHFKFPANPDATQQFEYYVYVSQIVQGLCVKYESEHYRRGREAYTTMGAIYWQLNDIWQGPTWSSMEYNGRWKLAHNYAVDFFAPTLISSYEKPVNTLQVYAVSDLEDSITSSSLLIEAVSWADGSVLGKWSTTFSINPQTSSKVYSNTISSMIGARKRSECVFVLTWTNSLGELLSENTFFLSDFQDVSLPSPNITVSNVTSIDESSARLTLSSSTMAPFVFLQTSIPGRFSKNGFLIRPKTIYTVEFYGKSAFNPEDLLGNLTTTSLRETYI